MLIGIQGKKHVGKDTTAGFIAAQLLSRGRAATLVAFADPLKQVASSISGIPLEWFYDQNLKEVVFPGINKTPRQIMEEANGPFKKFWGDGVFVYPVARMWSQCQKDGTPLVVTDVRFQSEADWVREQGGVIVRVHRKTGSRSTAVSEVGLPPHPKDFVITNNGSKSQLESKVRYLVNTLIAGGGLCGFGDIV